MAARTEGGTFRDSVSPKSARASLTKTVGSTASFCSQTAFALKPRRPWGPQTHSRVLSLRMVPTGTLMALSGATSDTSSPSPHRCC